MSITKTILILSANPKNTARLRLDEEVREIHEGLRRSRQREQFIIHQQGAVRLQDLQRAILDYEPHIVHFCGHGETDGVMVENDQGEAIIVPPNALAELFELFQQQVECVFLNACYSANQAEAVHQHINYVIGLTSRISDNAAIEFATGFYYALGSGKVVEEAFQFGRNAVKLYNFPEHTFCILKKKQIKQHCQLCHRETNQPFRCRTCHIDGIGIECCYDDINHQCIRCSTTIPVTPKAQEIMMLQNTERPFSVRIWTEIAQKQATKRNIYVVPRKEFSRYRIGDRVRVYFQSSTDAYVYMINIGPTGDLTRIFPPNEYSSDNHVKGGKKYTFPAEDDQFEWILQEPAGTETIKVFATKIPIDIDQFLNDQISKPDTRNIAVRFKQPQTLTSDQWAEASCTLLVQK